MSQHSTTNTFKEGLVMDLNDLAVPNNILTNALNATLLTMNGNELMLQNDMGNGRIDRVRLDLGYIPTGMKSYGGIIYVTSYNPETHKGQIGSFPYPKIDYVDMSDVSTGDNNLPDIFTEESMLLNEGCTNIKSEMLHNASYEKYYTEYKITFDVEGTEKSNSYIILREGDSFLIGFNDIPSIYYADTVNVLYKVGETYLNIAKNVILEGKNIYVPKGASGILSLCITLPNIEDFNYSIDLLGNNIKFCSSNPDSYYIAARSTVNDPWQIGTCVSVRASASVEVMPYAIGKTEDGTLVPVGGDKAHMVKYLNIPSNGGVYLYKYSIDTDKDKSFKIHWTYIEKTSGSTTTCAPSSEVVNIKEDFYDVNTYDPSNTLELNSIYFSYVHEEKVPISGSFTTTILFDDLPSNKAFLHVVRKLKSNDTWEIVFCRFLFTSNHYDENSFTTLLDYNNVTLKEELIDYIPSSSLFTIDGDIKRTTVTKEYIQNSKVEHIDNYRLAVDGPTVLFDNYPAEGSVSDYRNFKTKCIFNFAPKVVSDQTESVYGNLLDYVVDDSFKLLVTQEDVLISQIHDIPKWNDQNHTLIKDLSGIDTFGTNTISVSRGIGALSSSGILEGTKTFRALLPVYEKSANQAEEGVYSFTAYDGSVTGGLGVSRNASYIDCSRLFPSLDLKSLGDDTDDIQNSTPTPGLYDENSTEKKVTSQLLLNTQLTAADKLVTDIDQCFGLVYLICPEKATSSEACLRQSGHEECVNHYAGILGRDDDHDQINHDNVIIICCRSGITGKYVPLNFGSSGVNWYTDISTNGINLETGESYTTTVIAKCWPHGDTFNYKVTPRTDMIYPPAMWRLNTFLSQIYTLRDRVKNYYILGPNSDYVVYSVPDSSYFEYSVKDIFATDTLNNKLNTISTSLLSYNIKNYLTLVKLQGSGNYYYGQFLDLQKDYVSNILDLYFNAYSEDMVITQSWYKFNATSDYEKVSDKDIYMLNVDCILASLENSDTSVYYGNNLYIEQMRDSHCTNYSRSSIVNATTANLHLFYNSNTHSVYDDQYPHFKLYYAMDKCNLNQLTDTGVIFQYDVDTFSYQLFGDNYSYFLIKASESANKLLDWNGFVWGPRDKISDSFMTVKDANSKIPGIINDKVNNNIVLKDNIIYIDPHTHKILYAEDGKDKGTMFFLNNFDFGYYKFTKMTKSDSSSRLPNDLYLPDSANSYTNLSRYINCLYTSYLYSIDQTRDPVQGLSIVDAALIIVNPAAVTGRQDITIDLDYAGATITSIFVESFGWWGYFNSKKYTINTTAGLPQGTINIHTDEDGDTKQHPTVSFYTYKQLYNLLGETELECVTNSSDLYIPLRLQIFFTDSTGKLCATTKLWKFIGVKSADGYDTQTGAFFEILLREINQEIRAASVFLYKLTDGQTTITCDYEINNISNSIPITIENFTNVSNVYKSGDLVHYKNPIIQNAIRADLMEEIQDKTKIPTGSCTITLRYKDATSSTFIVYI